MSLTEYDFLLFVSLASSSILSFIQWFLSEEVLALAVMVSLNSESGSLCLFFIDKSEKKLRKTTKGIWIWMKLLFSFWLFIRLNFDHLYIFLSAIVCKIHKLFKLLLNLRSLKIVRFCFFKIQTWLVWLITLLLM